MSEEREDKCVVYEYTEKAGGLAGNRYFTSYNPQTFSEDFDSADGVTARDGTLKVLAKDIPHDEAFRLCCAVSRRQRLAGVIELSKVEGRVVLGRLAMNLANICACPAPGDIAPRDN